MLNIKIAVFLLVAILNIQAAYTQDTTLDVLYETSFNEHLIYLRQSNDYVAWYNTLQNRLYRIHNGTVESRDLPQEYWTCNSLEELRLYNDFLYFRIGDDTRDFCRQGFVWGENSLELDDFDIGEIVAQYENYFIPFGASTLIDIAAKTKTPLRYESGGNTYRFGTSFSMNASYIHGSMGKYDANGNRVGNAIVAYNWQTNELTEIYASSNRMIFNDQQSHDTSIAFIEEGPDGDPAGDKLFFYDGNNLSLILQGNDAGSVAATSLGASSYLGGVAYVLNDDLYYWKDGNTRLLGQNLPRPFEIQDNILAWFTGFGRDSKIHFFDGSNFSEIAFVGFPENFQLLADNSFVLTYGDVNRSSRYVVSGVHDLESIPLGVSENCTTGSVVTGTIQNGAAPKALNGSCTNHDVFKVAGSGNSTFGSQDGPAQQATFNGLDGIDIDGMGNIYVADFFNHVIRKITPQGTVSTLAGQAGIRGFRDGVGSTALFDEPLDLAVDFVGNVYVADKGNDIIRKITPDGMVSTYAGNRFQGNTDGIGTSAQFILPGAVDLDSQGNLYVAESYRVRKIDSQQNVSTIAVFPNETLYSFSDLAVAPSGIIYVANLNGRVIHQITPDGTSSILAGQLGVAILQDGVGTLATFNSPVSIEIDNCGNLYLVESFALRRITPAGVVTTIFDNHTTGLDIMSGIAFDRAGNLLVTDAGLNSIYRFGNCSIDGDNDGYIEAADCDDTNAAVNAGAAEIPNNGIDEDCDGSDLITALDNDNDGYSTDVDCNDNNAAINPGATEIANSGFDENCDGVSLIIDNDGDGYNSSIDCDDNNAAINGRATEIPNNGIDEDCNGSDLVTTIDNDGDGYTAEVDCNDNNAAINPGAAEIANSGFDENCDGISLIIDNDGDGYNSSIDCDDNNAAINGRATEIPNNGIDEDCNGSDLVTSTDNDNDGYSVEEDCNDNDAAINPSAAEIANNGIDDNCDGISLAFATCLTYRPDGAFGKDAYIGTNVDNRGTHPDFAAIAWTNNGVPVEARGLLDFDFSFVPIEATILSAKLSLYSYVSPANGSHSPRSGSNESVLQRITSPWEEQEVTWSSQPTSTTQNQVVLPRTTSEIQDYLDIDVTAMVQDMVSTPENSHGFLLKLMDENFYRSVVFASSDNEDASLHPKLELCFVVNNSLDSEEHIVTHYLYEEDTYSLSPHKTQELKEEIISVFPNPTNSILYLKDHELLPNSFNIEWTDYTGKQLYQQQMTKQSNMRMDIGHLPKGLLIMRIHTADRIVSKKVMVVR